MVTELAPAKDIVSWDDLDTLTAGLAERLEGRPFDVLLAIARGGLVPAGMLAYRLGIREILVAAVAAYDDHGHMAPTPLVIHFPPEERFRDRDVLVVDEVWETGNTAVLVAELVRQAGGRPTTAVLHYKPARSLVNHAPDVHAVTTDQWVVYPYKAGR
jgi:hypoxanthine phosphoribosyltransferase